jgi:hypothetical protein
MFGECLRLSQSLFSFNFCRLVLIVSVARGKIYVILSMNAWFLCLVSVLAVCFEDFPFCFPLDVESSLALRGAAIFLLPYVKFSFSSVWVFAESAF